MFLKTHILEDNLSHVLTMCWKFELDWSIPLGGVSGDPTGSNMNSGCSHGLGLRSCLITLIMKILAHLWWNGEISSVSILCFESVCPTQPPTCAVSKCDRRGCGNWVRCGTWNSLKFTELAKMPNSILMSTKSNQVVSAIFGNISRVPFTEYRIYWFCVQNLYFGVVPQHLTRNSGRA